MTKELVFISNNKVVTDSLTIADVFGKEHSHVLRDIDTQMDKLREAGEIEFSLSNFGESTYINERGRRYPKFDLTEEAFTIIAMSYLTPQAMKMKVRFIQEFKRMREVLNQPKPLSEREQLKASLKLTLDTSEKVEELDHKVKTLENKVEEQITLDHGEQRRIQRAVSSKVYKIASEQDERKMLFSELYRDIKDRFGIGSYRDLKRKDMLSAINYIEAWIPKKKVG